MSPATEVAPFAPHVPGSAVCRASGRRLPALPFDLAAVGAALARVPRLPAAERSPALLRELRRALAEHGVRWCGSGRRRAAYRAPGGWVLKHVWRLADADATARELAHLTTVAPADRVHFAEPFDLGGGVTLQPEWPPDHARYAARRREILTLAARYGIARDLTEDNVGWRGERWAIIDWERADDAWDAPSSGGACRGSSGAITLRFATRA